MTLKGTQTEKNVMTAFAGESAARNRYTYWASQAKKDGFEQISAIFQETADQEKEHAKRLFKFLEGGDCAFTVTLPAGTIASTLENLIHAAEGEEHEYQHMYPEYAEIAKKEGFPEIAGAMLAIAKAEKFHGDRYRKLAANIENGNVFNGAAGTVWRCRNCGYTHVGEKALEKCPACLHVKAHFEIAPSNW